LLHTNFKDNFKVWLQHTNIRRQHIPLKWCTLICAFRWWLQHPSFFPNNLRLPWGMYYVIHLIRKI